MNGNEMIILQANILGGMNTYIREIIGDDEATDYWNTYGIPDECNEEDLMEIAKDYNSFRDICKAFSIITFFED